MATAANAELALVYPVLFERVISCWPASIDVAQLCAYDGRSDLYVVTGLGQLGDSISETFESEADAVLLTSLCDAITSTVRSAALFCTEVKPALLRADTVRENFEKRLHQALEKPDLGWRDEDILLIRRYFVMNTKGPSVKEFGDAPLI